MQVNKNGYYTARQEFNLGSKHIEINDIEGRIMNDEIFTSYDDGVLMGKGIILDTDYCNYMIWYSCMDDFQMHSHSLSEEQLESMANMTQQQRNQLFNQNC